MKILKEEPLRNQRQFKHDFVQGRDGKFYKILTFQLYDAAPPPEFQNFEVNIQEVSAGGTFKELIVPHMKRFFTKQEALTHHEMLLVKMDDVLELVEVKEHKKEDAKAEENAH